ncbi:MAG: asparaginase [Hyphomicrobiales bacterium]|nr:asparaginase [Hyphomicrobiales bacterium]
MSTRPRLLVIYTGGTLGMRPSPRGYIAAADISELIAERMPELRDGSWPALEIVEYDPPLDSANLTPKHWYRLAETITERAASVDGVIIIHGTDTLAFTASALSFLLIGLDKAVVVTGSQIPLAEPRNDARGNLLAAIEVAAGGRSTEVSVCFGSRLMRGNRTTKTRAQAFDAFDSPNHPYLADIGTEILYREGLTLQRAPGTAALMRPVYAECAIAVVPAVPGLPASAVDAVAQSGARGMILECFGMGTAPTDDAELLEAIGRATRLGLVVVAISQCRQGHVSLATYAAGRKLLDCGVVSGFDMTREAALTKMHTLFARGLSPMDVAARMQQDLCGEMTLARVDDLP